MNKCLSVFCFVLQSFALIGYFNHTQKFLKNNVALFCDMRQACVIAKINKQSKIQIIIIQI